MCEMHRKFVERNGFFLHFTIFTSICVTENEMCQWEKCQTNKREEEFPKHVHRSKSIFQESKFRDHTQAHTNNDRVLLRHVASFPISMKM